MPESFYLLAAELAFGLLDDSQRMQAEQLRATNQFFAKEVAQWEVVAEGWIGELPDHPTSRQLWDRVTAMIAPNVDNQVPYPSAVATRHIVQTQNPGVWRSLAMAASLLSCLFAGLWLSHTGTSLPPQTSKAAAGTNNTATTGGRFSVAQITGVGDPHLATVLYDRSSGTLTIRVAAIAPDPAKAPEIWLINGTNPPQSLGFGQAGTATRMTASVRLQHSIVGGATLAITLEPIAGQPHKAPSSKILGTGIISTL